MVYRPTQEQGRLMNNWTPGPTGVGLHCPSEPVFCGRSIETADQRMVLYEAGRMA